ncbi:Bcr/CflA family efflux MFS transporter [Crystallibacter degradans]|uniref:Bcr/CflA family efflux MFS transporter n=1 Tax=Crystallibacter degradans TaxID=2726743 RepID=UPI0014736A6B|nr:Bcr/CflA family efflux MFS transporter [Arthrobacter sp. SF27]NMR30364.1 multidrug effflux MFS transporter [Arthrobacter sp. SF27]
MTVQRTTPAMSGPLLAVLALLAAAAPLSSDMYLASLPMIATDLGVRASGAQFTLTALLLGIALGQLAFGPLSDRYGRIRPLMVGVAIAVVACIAAALAQDIWFLVGARFVQGFAAAAGIVIGRAIISDLNAGLGAARAFTLLLTISSLAPVLAPLLGSVLLAAGSWRSIFWVSAGIFAVMLGGVLLVVRETHPPHARDKAALLAAGEVVRRAFKGGLFPAYVLQFAFTFGVIISYISASSFVYQNLMGFSAIGYGTAAAVNALGMMACGLISVRLIRRFVVRRIIAAALMAQLFMTGGIFVLVMTGAPAIWAAIPIFFAISCSGFLMGNTTSLAIGTVRQAAGQGSAVLGASQFVLGALVTPLAGIGGGFTAVPMALLMLGCCLCAGALFLVSGRIEARRTA